MGNQWIDHVSIITILLQQSHILTHILHLAIMDTTCNQSHDHLYCIPSHLLIICKLTRCRYGFFRTIHNSFRFTFWESMLIGACVAPTDPVLASAVSTSALAISQVPARLRHTITAGSFEGEERDK